MNPAHNSNHQLSKDLFAAYDFIDKHTINLKNVQKAHSILSSSLLPKSQQGLIRTNPMFVINSEDQTEYVAANPAIVKHPKYSPNAVA